MKLKKCLAALLCFALILCCAPFALAAEDTATVTFWYANGSEMNVLLQLTVSDGTAESYGYTVAKADHNDVAIEAVTAMDVLVAAHKEIYGDAFTKDTANDYLAIGNSFLYKAFGIETSNMGFTINDVMPHDDTYTELSFGGYYMGYAIDTARIKDGDRMCLFMYKSPKWADILPLFGKTTINAVPNEAFTVSVSGYSVMNYGCSKQETIDENTKPLEGVTVECTQDFKTFTKIGTLDMDGKLSVTLPEIGTYYLVVRGTYEDPVQKSLPVIATFIQVDVKQGQRDNPLLQSPLYLPYLIYPTMRLIDGKLHLLLVIRFVDLHNTRDAKTFELDLFNVLRTLFAKVKI